MKDNNSVQAAHRDDASSGNNDIYQKMISEVEDYAIIFLDVNGIIKNWNKGAEKIKQYTEQEAVGNHFQMFYLQEDRLSRLPEKLLHQARTEGKAVHEGWRLRKDGTRFWGSITLTALHADNGEVIGFSKVTRDLTERKLVEDRLKLFTEELQKGNEELRKSEERYHKMISEVVDYAIILLDEYGNIQNWNAGAEKIKGYTAEQIIGKNFRIFYLPEDRAAGIPERLIKEAATNGKALHEGLRVRRDGSTFWGSIVITALHAEDGAIIGFSKVTRDLTERKVTEQRITKYLEELEAQNKELEQFAYVASHDLQEPLRKIRTFTEVIERNFSDDQLVKKYFEKINASAQRMSEQIKAILNYSRLSVMENFVEVDLNDVLAHILDDFEVLIQERNARILQEPLPPITASPLQLNQLFANLVGNALKFSAEDPLIKISSSIVDKADIDDAPAYMPAGQYLQIAVADNGIGFDQQYAKQIFTLFQRLHGKQEYAGTGIGLALCKKIMDNHHGFISAVGEKGRGATFYTYFPLALD